MIPTERQVASGAYRLVDGTWHKRCSGPAHEELAWLPATPKFFYFRRNGSARAGTIHSGWCRLCTCWRKAGSQGLAHGLVETRAVEPLYREAVNRVGLEEVIRRSGVSIRNVHDVLGLRTRHTQKAKARAVILELVSVRRRNEYSISNGARRFAADRNNNGVETCSGCGTPLGNYTEGCNSCSDRKGKRRARVGDEN